jgi:hypothetical protein
MGSALHLLTIRGRKIHRETGFLEEGSVNETLSKNEGYLCTRVYKNPHGSRCISTLCETAQNKLFGQSSPILLEPENFLPPGVPKSIWIAMEALRSNNKRTFTNPLVSNLG